MSNHSFDSTSAAPSATPDVIREEREAFYLRLKKEVTGKKIKAKRKTSILNWSRTRWPSRRIKK